MSNINEVFGEARLGGGNGTHWFKFPKEGGSLVLRILPPYGSLREAGRWSQYYVTHFGYRDTKGKMRTFESPEVTNRQNKMIEVADPAMDRIRALRSAQEKAKVEGNVELAKKISEQLRIFNAKKAHYMNVMDLDGRIGVLAIPHKMYMALDAKLKELKQKGINALAAQGGRYLVFTRNGTGVNTTHSVEVYRDPSTDQQVVSNLTVEVANRMLSEGVDLGKLFIRPTSEEVGEIVKNNGGAVLEAVLSKYRKNSGANDVADVVVDEDEDSSESLSASQVSNPTVQATTTMAAAPVAQELDNMSDEDFLKSLGI